MKKLKLLSTVCALAVLTTMATSCTSKNSADDGKSNSNKELVYWTVGSGTGDYDSALEEMNKIVEDELGFTMKVNIIDWGDFGTKRNTILQSGEKFDLMFVDQSCYGSAVELGALADITDLVEKEAPKLKELVPEQLWDGVKIKDKIYAVPTYKDSALSQYWYFDKKYIDKYNIDVSNVKTYADLDKVFKTVKDGEGDKFYPLYMTQSMGPSTLRNKYDCLCSGLPFIGVKMDDKSRKVVSVFEQEDVLEQLNYFHKWYQEGIINPDASTSTDMPTGRFYQATQGFPGSEVISAAGEGVDAYVPVRVIEPTYSTESIQASLNAVGKNSDNKAEALQFLELVNTNSKLRDIMAYGAEGKDFEYVEEGVVKKLNDSYGWPAYTQGTFFNMSTTEGAPKDQWDQVKKMNEEAGESSVLGFALDVEPINSELTACKTIYDKYKYELECGASDPNEIVPKMLDEARKAGLDKIIEEAQRQIDEYFAGK